MQNLVVIEVNGFKVNIDISGEFLVGVRCQFLVFFLSCEMIFSFIDLEELIFLLGDILGEFFYVFCFVKVCKMFVMRVCWSSVMIGKVLIYSQMYGLVKYMGEMDKFWNCLYGRFMMRYLCWL